MCRKSRTAGHCRKAYSPGGGLAPQPIEMSGAQMLRLSKNLPHDWKEQRCFLGFAA
jgi:hypothetical protein